MLLHWGRTLLLASPEFDGPITEKFREKLESLSLKILFLSLSFLDLFPSLLHSPSTSLVKMGSRGLVLFLPHVSPSLAPRIFLTPLSIYFGFPSNPIVPHVSYGPTWALFFFTHPTLDTWRLLGYPKRAKCLAPLLVPQKM